jgi:hypothetical protein
VLLVFKQQPFFGTGVMTSDHGAKSISLILHPLQKTRARHWFVLECLCVFNTSGSEDTCGIECANHL